MKSVLDKKYQNKRILLICPSNNDYPKTIKDVLESRGGKVHFYDERNNPNTIEKILLRKAPFVFKDKIESYYQHIIREEQSFNPNIVFVISPEAITKNIIKEMKQQFPKAFFVMFLWDSMENKNLDDIFEEFDECFSFDKRDCEKYGFKFRPLFFSREYYRDDVSEDDKPEEKYEYDFGFIGTLHSDRPMVINKVRKYCNQNGFTYCFYFFVQSKLLLIYWLLKSKDVRELKRFGIVHTDTMPRLMAEKKMEMTRCVIDVSHPKQNGLTMRTIEMFGLQRKLATTNKNVREHDFYNPANQIVIDKNNLNLDMNEVRKPYVQVEEPLYKKYSVDCWVDEVLEGSLQ